MRTVGTKYRVGCDTPKATCPLQTRPRPERELGRLDSIEAAPGVGERERAAEAAAELDKAILKEAASGNF